MLRDNKRKLCYTKKDIHVDLKYFVLHRKEIASAFFKSLVSHEKEFVVAQKLRSLFVTCKASQLMCLKLLNEGVI